MVRDPMGRSGWLSLDLFKTLQDGSIDTPTPWCPNTTPQACLHGKIQIPGSHLRSAESGSPEAWKSVKCLPVGGISVAGYTAHHVLRVIWEQRDGTGIPEGTSTFLALVPGRVPTAG